MKAHVSEVKKQEVSKLEELMKKSNVIALVDLTNLPSAQLQQIRSKLKDKLSIKVTKKRLIKIAIKNLKEKDLSKLLPHLETCMPALMFTEQDAFALYKNIKKNKSHTFAKAGQIAPNDLIVEAGPTNFPPGPIIGELGQAGIIAAVEEGKVVVKKDTVLAKEGEEIKPKAAEVLSKLGFKPMEVGLNITVIYDNGILYEKKVLDIDEGQYINNLKLANLEALNLSINVGYITKENLPHLIRKGYNEALIIKEKSGFEDKEAVVKKEIKEASKEAEKVKEKVEEKKEELKKEEVKVEVKKEEKPVEEKKLKEKKEEKIYSEEDAEKAKEIIAAMKDKDIKEKEEAKKKPKVEEAPDIHKLAEEAEKRKKEEEGGK